MKQRLIVMTLTLVFRVFSLLPIIPNVYVFESQYGGRFDDNPKAIYDFLKKQNGDNEKLYWSIRYRDRNIIKEKNIKILYRFSLRWLYYMARANYWIVNARMPKWLPKRKHTKYVQTWHGTPLKKLALDMDAISMPGTDLNSYKTNFLFETKKWDYLLAPNQYSKQIFESCFAFEKKFIECGYPRNDVLYTKNNEKDINDIKIKLGIPLDKKVVLYAPTWRDDYYISKGKYKFNVPFDVENLSEVLGADTVFIFRAHYLVADSLQHVTNYPNIYNFSKDIDISELYLIADLLVTDYSSVFFDYANLKRPMLFYAYDIEHYRDNLRGFYFDIESEAPGPVIKDEEAFYNHLQTFIIEGEFKEYNDKLNDFSNKYCAWEDGESSKKLIEYINRPSN